MTITTTKLSCVAICVLAFATLLHNQRRIPVYDHAAAAPTIIDFEDLPPIGEIVRDRYKNLGVVFQPVLGIDYSQGTPIPNFAHSGTKAVELCRGVETCRSELDITFTTPQRRVKMWAGFAGRLDKEEIVRLRAYDANNNLVQEVTTTIGPTGPIIAPPTPFINFSHSQSIKQNRRVVPISRPLEVQMPSATIVRVKAGLRSADPNFGTNFNNGLAFDDIEFDVQGPPPQCPATQPPAFTINEPTDGQIFVQNTLTIDANLTTPDPLATFQINVTGAGGRTFGPVFTPSGHISYPNLSGLLFEGQNTLRFIAKDCAGTTEVTRTVHYRPATRTVIHVTDESGANVEAARVYANGFFIGVTDANGMLMRTPPLSAGTQLVARKLVKESSTFRANHAQGSFQNWNYRVYTTSMGVNNDGSLTGKSVDYHPDPNAPQELRILRQNTLIGLHVVASLEWDASTVEIETARQKLIAASNYLYNATDGQMYFEQVEVVDDMKFWNEADYRIQANQNLGPHVNFPLGAFLINDSSTYSSQMNMRLNCEPHEFIHEFGHYGFGLNDEYKGDPAGCTATLIAQPPMGGVFGLNGSKASCLMDSNWFSSKLCSHRVENPHKNGTFQGESSCWTTIAENYRDSEGTPRWTLQTPDTRGAIPDRINFGDIPLDDMPPRFSFTNTSRPNLCQPITILATHSDGTPHADREIRLKTTYGQTILQGKTNQFGNLTITGGHVGDTVEGTKIEFVNCTVTAKLRPGKDLPNIAMPVSFSQDVEQGQQRLKIAPTPFNIVTVLKPKKKDGEIIVVTKDAAGQPVALDDSPIARVKTADAKTRKVRLRYHSKTRSYSGKVKKLPLNSDIEIEVEATNRQKQRAETVTIFRINQPEPKAKLEVISPNGQLTLTIPEGSLTKKGRVSIGSHSNALPDLPYGYSFVSGPFAVWSYPADDFYRPATVSFQLPRTRDRSAFANFAQDSLRVFHYDGYKWTEIGGVVPSPRIDFVTAKTTRLGVFALGGRINSKRDQQTSPIGMFGSIGESR